MSARTKKALGELATKYIDYLDFHPDVLIEDVCFTANIGRSHFNHRLAVCTTSIADLRTKLTKYIAQKKPSELWQGKINSNQNIKLALIFEQENKVLKESIESIIICSLASLDVADICWQIGEQKKADNEQLQNTIYSQTNPKLDNWQILIDGLARLYILGININWKVLYKNNDAKKISLPTYPFQRQTYWID